MKKTKLVGALLAGVMAVTGAPGISTPLTASISAASKLSAPSGVKASAATESVTLSWKAVKGADAYLVSQKNKYMDRYDEVKTVTGTTCTIDDLRSGEEYTFRITTLVKSGKTYTKQGSTKDLTVKTKIKAPSYISVTPGSKSVTVSWYKTSGADAYRVFKYNTKTKKFEQFKDTTDTSITFDGLKAGESVRFRLGSLVKSGNSYKLQETTSSMTAVASEAPAFELPDIPEFGTSAAKVLKKLGITTYSCFGGTDGSVIYIEGSVMSLLSGSVNMLMFDKNDHFYAGIYYLSGGDISDISTALTKKNGKGTSLNQDGAEVTLWDSDDVLKLAAVMGAGGSSSGSFSFDISNGTSSVAYVEICKKYAPKELIESFKNWKGGLDAFTSIS